jgi:hypothetical protein
MIKKVYFVLDFCLVLYSISIKTIMDSEIANTPKTINAPTTKIGIAINKPLSPCVKK